MNRPIDRRKFFKWSATGLMGAGLTMAAPSASAADAAQKRAVLKKALCFGMTPPQISVEERFKLVKDCGFDGVEAGTTGDEKQVAALRAAADKAGVRIHSVMNAGWKDPLSSDDPAVVERGLSCMRTSLNNAKAFGADAVLLVPAVVKPPVTHEQAYERSQKNIKTLVPLAQELGVLIAVENVWNNFLLKSDEFVRYVDEFQSPYVCAYFDVGNIVKYGAPQDWIRALGPRIKKIHLKDYDSKKNAFVPLREGSVDWPAVRRALDEIGYDGFLTAELKGGDEAYLRDVGARMDKIIAGE